MKISLIGDSIRMQYENRVRELLGDEFECFSPEENCRFAKYNLRGMWDWKMGMLKSRVVHWNCGLWDICEIFDEGMFTSLEEYTATVLRVADILLSRHEKVIFATMTPVSDKNVYNKNTDIERYNHLVSEKLREKGVIINDLYALVNADRDRYISEDNIHLTEEGIEACAKQVAEVILSVAQELPNEEKASDESLGEIIQDGAPVIFDK